MYEDIVGAKWSGAFAILELSLSWSFRYSGAFAIYLHYYKRNFRSKKEWRPVPGRETTTINRTKVYIIEIAATSHT
jgi:hypothetical protein